MTDTAKKRSAASGEQLPFPDGTIDAADRAQITGEYFGQGEAASTEMIYQRSVGSPTRIRRIVRVAAY